LILGRTGNRRRPQPACDSADTHKIRHHEVARLFLERSVHITRTIKVLTDLYGCPQFCRKLCKTVEIVVDDWLLNPCETEIIDRMAAL
jgi:hypothetical protein